MVNRGKYTGPIGFNIYNPGDSFYANRGVGAQRPTPNHKGADWGTHGAVGVSVSAAIGGKVTAARTDANGYGMQVTVETDTPNGKLVITYGHIKPASGLVFGKSVQAGQLLGTVENATTLTSNGGTLSTATNTFLPHLHLQITLGGVLQDPYTFNQWGPASHMMGVKGVWGSKGSASQFILNRHATSPTH